MSINIEVVVRAAAAKAANQGNKQQPLIIMRRGRLAAVVKIALLCLVVVINKQSGKSSPQPGAIGVIVVNCFANNRDNYDSAQQFQINYNRRFNLDSDDDDRLFASELQRHHRLVARSELFAGNIGLETDGVDALRSLSSEELGSQDDRDNNNNQDTGTLSSNLYRGRFEETRSAAASTSGGDGTAVPRNEIYLLEDKDYPRSLFEDYQRRVGQVSGITTLPSNDVAIFHRSARHWTSATFNESSRQINNLQALNSNQIGADKLIKNDTIMIIDGESGNSVASFGSNLFYLPHSIASDNLGNLWVSDVARHQVMRLPASSITTLIEQQSSSNANTNTNNNNNNNKSTVAVAAEATIQRQIWPDIILGEAFVPGSDRAHFCQPSEIAISSNGLLVFVADGYCNGRIMVFTGTGKFVASFGEQQNLSIVHSLTLIEERNLLCVADRENGRILCYRAGLDGNLMRLGELVYRVNYPLGRVFAITSLSEDHLLVSSNQVGTNRYDLAILNPFTNKLKLVWISSDLLEPHSLATTRDRQASYAADISEGAYKKVFKFNVIRRKN